MDDEPEARRERELGAFPDRALDARHARVRAGGIVRAAAVRAAVGVDPDGRRRIPGVSAEPSEAEVHRRGFLDRPVARGLCAA